MSILDTNKEAIIDLCEKYHVAELHAFGSVLTDNFKASSDVDLIVKFKDIELGLYADNYFDFKFSLQDLLKRDVDLLESQAIRNPYFKNSIDGSKALVYG